VTKRLLTLIGFGLGGVALVIGLTLGAFALAGPDIGRPVPPAPIERSSSAPTSTKTPDAERSHHERSEHPPSPDDHGGTSVAGGTSGSGDHTGTSGTDTSTGSSGTSGTSDGTPSDPGTDDHGGSSGDD
jgi:hypothetical protein